MLETIYLALSDIGDNAVTSSIRIAQVFPKLVGKKLFQEGQLPVTGESMCTKYWLTT